MNGGELPFIAAEEVNVTINQGLFDIQFVVGTDSLFPISHLGTTGGPSSTGPGDNHRIDFAAASKNAVITAFVAGNVGFQPAANVGIENGVIVLSAG